MATNEILPFASTNTGTNLLTQAEYVSDAQRTTGNQPGIARSKLVNKALRQSSLLAAGLAEFIADYQSNNVTDSLTAQNIADYLLAAIQANIPTIPDASTTTKGIIEIATATEAQAYSSSLLAITPATMAQALQGGNQSLATSGYQKLPGGLIVQWGQTTFVSGPGSYNTVTFPVVFPNQCLNIGMTVGGINANPQGAMGNTTLYPEAVSTSGFKYWVDFQSGGTYTITTYYIALGR